MEIYSTHNKEKSIAAERFIKTLKNKTERVTKENSDKLHFKWKYLDNSFIC